MTTSIDDLERIAATYHTNPSVPDIHIENLCQEYFIEWLCRRIPKGTRVLELGYGDGLVTSALVNCGCKLTVLEGAATLVKNARGRHPGLECVHILFEEFRPSCRYDLVVASHVLEHVVDPVGMLRLIASWMDDNGQVIIVVPNRNSLHRQLAVLMGLQPALDTLSQRDLLVGHKRVYSLSDLKADASRAGLGVVETSGFFLKVLPNSMMLEFSRDLLWALNQVSESMPTELLANIAVVATKA